MFTKMKSAEEAPLIPNSTSPERQSQHHEYDNNQERYQRTALFPERSTSRSLLLSVIVALGILAVTTGSATLIFPRGASSWAPSTITGAADSSQIGGKDTEAFLLKRSSNRTTEQCAGDAALPVLRGVDVVAYYSIEAGASAVYGYEEYEAIINGYRFYFASKENKELFEDEPSLYMPAWGGFCSWGIAMEDWWAADTLGPDADPNSWLITPDGVLHIFRSPKPQRYFMANVLPNIEKGNAVWKGWFGDAAPGVGENGSPMDTACFCDVSTCTDG